MVLLFQVKPNKQNHEEWSCLKKFSSCIKTLKLTIYPSTKKNYNKLSSNHTTKLQKPYDQNMQVPVKKKSHCGRLPWPFLLVTEIQFIKISFMLPSKDIHFPERLNLELFWLNSVTITQLTVENCVPFRLQNPVVHVFQTVPWGNKLTMLQKLFF